MGDPNSTAPTLTMANIMRHHGLYEAVGLASRLARLLEQAKGEGLNGADYVDAVQALEEAKAAGLLNGRTKPGELEPATLQVGDRVHQTGTVLEVDGNCPRVLIVWDRFPATPTWNWAQDVRKMDGASHG